MMRVRTLGRWIVGLVGLWLLIYFILVTVFQPSHDRSWELGHEALPRVLLSATSSLVTIENYRNFTWTGEKEAEVRYETRTVDMANLTGVDVLISHFDDFEGLAHIFLSFRFRDGDPVVISLETRREKGEEFSPLLGILRQYEIIYVVGTEADIVGVRTGPRDERVYLYPTVATSGEARQLFLELATSINDVYETPQMYNTLTHNCTNELTRPVERISTVDFPLTWKTILPGYFDEILYDLKLIDTSSSFATVKAAHELKNDALDERSPTYSADVRAQIGVGR